MASSRIDINVNGKDNTKGAFNSTSNSIRQLGQDAKTAGSTVGSSLSSGATKAAGSIRSLGSSASSTFSMIKSGAQAASAELGGIGSALAGIGGAFSALQIGQSAWTGATQRQFNEMYLGTVMGKNAANQYLDVISKIVAQVPGDDTWMNSLLTGTLAKQTDLSADMLTRLGVAASKYVTAAQQTGASILPANAERELTSYIKSGNTGLMVRDGLLKNHVEELQKAKTPAERILALEKAMTEENYLQLDTASLVSSKWEVIKGQMQLAATNVGMKLLPFVERLLDFIMDVDEATNGWSSTIALVGAAIVGIGLALATPVSATIAAWVAMKKYRQEAQAAAIANGLNKGPGVAAGGAATTGLVQSVKNILWTVIPSAMAGFFASGGGLAGIAGAVTSFAASAGATIASSVAMGFSAALGPAFLGLFEDGSLLGKDYNFWANLNPQLDQIKKDIGGFTKYMGKTKDDIVTLWNAMSNGIKWAWNSTDNFVKGGIRSLAGAMRATFNQAASAVIGSFNWMRGGAQSALNSIVGTYNWAKGVVSGGMTSVANFFANGWQSVLDTYYRVKSIVSNAITSVVNFVTGNGPRGPSPGASIGMARGPFDGIGLKYENYAGHKKDAWTSSGNLSGNCVDMSLGLIQAAGTGSLVSGTWNGNPHVWANINGQNYDPARKALQGTWSPPARGPSGNAGGTIFDLRGATILDGPSFERTMDKYMNKHLG